jgi:hypothetical protein
MCAKKQSVQKFVHRLEIYVFLKEKKLTVFADFIIRAIFKQEDPHRTQIENFYSKVLQDSPPQGQHVWSFKNRKCPTVKYPLTHTHTHTHGQSVFIK